MSPTKNHPAPVADVRANHNENIQFAVNIIGRSAARLKVFEAVYKGQKPGKTVKEISEITGLKKMRVLQEGTKLADNHIVGKEKINGETIYLKDRFYNTNKNKVLAIISNPEKKKNYPTKQEPAGSTKSITIRIKGKTPSFLQITIDEIDSFSKVKSIARPDRKIKLDRVPEPKIKKFLQEILGDTHVHTDWGGETNDFYTNKLRFRGIRKVAAFALKGKGTSGPLTPKKMGKNGDQISRLFVAPAQFFFVVYHSKVSESIDTQMEAAALSKAMSGKKIYFCIIDGDDLNRLYQAYADMLIDATIKKRT